MMPKLWILFLLFYSSPLLSLYGQKSKPDKGEEVVLWENDPYTHNDTELLARLGYVKTGRFHWADNHSTKDIEEALGGVRMRWLETKHFRLGCSLPSYTIDTGSRTEKTKIQAELKRLKEFFPKLSTKSRKLDPWLRLHLYAMRAEDLYQQIESLLQVDDADFPSGPGIKLNGRYMGEGPYLGMKSKFTILLFEKESSLGRYRAAFMGTQGDKPIRHMFPFDGTLLFGVAAENEGMFADTTMHCLFTYSLSMNLLNGFRYYRHRLPEWVNVGLGHWYARQIDPTRNYFTEDRLFGSDDKNIWKWGPKVRARVGHDYYPSFEKIMNYANAESMKYSEHMLAWSRIDFLMAQKREGFALWFDLLKEPYPNGVVPSAESLKQCQVDALAQAWQLSPSTFDREWAAWCLQHYPKK